MTSFRSQAGLALATAALLASPADAAVYIFDFSTTDPLIGIAGSGSGTITTDDINFESRGFTAQTITGITGTFNGSTIVGLTSLSGSNNLFYVSGPSFVDSSGLAFRTASGNEIGLFFQASVGSYRISSTGPFISSLATASAVPAVPEPAGWAMMLLGFGLTGFVIRRSRRSSPAPRIA